MKANSRHTVQKIGKALNQTSCFYCGKQEDLTVDHIISKKNKGLNTLANYQILCNDCNFEKSAIVNEKAVRVVTLGSIYALFHSIDSSVRPEASDWFAAHKAYFDTDIQRISDPYLMSRVLTCSQFFAYFKYITNCFPILETELGLTPSEFYGQKSGFIPEINLPFFSASIRPEEDRLFWYEQALKEENERKKFKLAKIKAKIQVKLNRISNELIEGV